MLAGIPLAIWVAVVVLFSIVVAASGRDGRSSQASLATSSSWSEDLSTDEALAVLSSDELQHTERDMGVLMHGLHFTHLICQSQHAKTHTASTIHLQCMDAIT